MRIDEVRKVYHEQPFQPFTIRVADGHEYTVKHPEFLSISVSGRSIVVSTPDDLHELIDVMMITSIHFGNGKVRRRRRR